MQKLLYLLIGLALLNSPPLLAIDETETTPPQTVPTDTPAQSNTDDC